MDKNLIIEAKFSKQIPGLDILKFVMALLIVAIHSEAVKGLKYINEIAEPLINSAVPVFFVVSSFLLFRKMRINSKNEEINGLSILRHFTYRLFLLYTFWLAVQIPLVLYTRHYLSMNFYEFIGNFILDIGLRSTFHGAWFFSALVVGVWIIFRAGKIFNDKMIWILPFCITMYTYHANSLPIEQQALWNWYYDNINNPQNSFPVSLFWISIGYIMANPRIVNYMSSIKSNYLVGGGILAWIVCIFGIDIRVIIVVSIFIMSFKWKGNYKPIHRIMRQSSILIFTLHFIYIGIFRLLFPKIEWFQHGLILYVFLLIMCFVSSLVILKLKDYKYFSWLKFAY